MTTSSIDTTTSVRRLSSIPRIDPKSIEEGDLYAWSSETIGPGYFIWCAVILRPRTGELFRVRCYDGEKSSYFPQIKDGALPEGTQIDDDVRIYGDY
jgi:hypothetical protein